MYPSNYDIVVIFAGVASYFSTVLLGIFTFGDAIFFHVMWHLFTLMFPDIASSTPFGERYLFAATMILSVRSAFVQPFFCYRSRKFACRQLLWVSLPTATLFTWLGTLVLVWFGDSPWLGPMLGVAYGSMALLFAWSTYRKAMENEAKGHVVMAMHNTATWTLTTCELMMLAAACCAGGFLSGLVNVGGPPMMLMSLYLNLPHPAVRGMAPFVFGTSLCSRFILGVALGLYDPSAWMLFVAVVIGGWAGLPVGIELAGLLTHDTMAFSSCWIIFFAAVGTAGVSVVWTLAAFVTAAASFAFFNYRRRQERQRRSDVQLPADVVVDGDITDPGDRDDGIAEASLPSPPPADPSSLSAA